ncbi:copper homeostasis protein CutC [Palleronia sediminis]|uniref:PF03932 family protein CutC n=1 Tax=Palleronia sediminis TaxID=2547833 RepID=A0A4R5ZW56_9RHOB|nr:copper homeostasis protein CutC [Palleronia sediminis]TDL74127.1 copper homeostasis protein CutC [Palleronia sediminis]
MTRMLEICVDSHEGLSAAVAGGADRIELCAALALGGLSPSEALLQAAMRCPLPVHAMIRPRAGGFDYGEAELTDMEREIDRIRDLGLAGVVLGAGSRAGLDFAALGRLAARARGMAMTLHRVIDLVPSPSETLDRVAALGFTRVLSSGGATTAWAGRATLAAMVHAAPPGLAIMAGGGVSAGNAADLVAATGVHELHGSASAAAPEPDADLVRLGFAPPAPRRTDRVQVARLARIVRGG